VAVTSTADPHGPRPPKTNPPGHRPRRADPRLGVRAETLLTGRSREELRRKAESTLAAKELSTGLLRTVILLASLEPPAGTYAGHQVSRKRLEGTDALAPALLRSCVLYAMLPRDGRYASATELAWATALPRPTTVKILTTLAALDLIERAPNANNFRLPT
jgi:hypothetical protein